MFIVIDVVTDVPGHSSARQVLVQGNAIKTVTKLLEGSLCCVCLSMCEWSLCECVCVCVYV